MKTPAKAWVKYAITAGCCLLVAAVYFFAKIPMSSLAEASAMEVSRVLCDAFFLPGVLTLMSGLLMWVASEGALDGIGYLGSFLVKTLIPGKRTETERYGDYVQRKRENRKKGYGFLCVVGLAYVVLAALVLVWFYSVYQA